jgi:SAM-dependent methyltransferase
VNNQAHVTQAWGEPALAIADSWPLLSEKAFRCRSCGYKGLTTVLSFGRVPLANALLTAEQLDEPEPTYPLDLVFCPSCTLVQITETVPPAKLFREYLYFSSFSDTMLSHAKHLSERLIRERCLNSDSLVVEVASNDGYLLQYYHQKRISVLGIEPALNTARVAQVERGIPTICEFFDDTVAERLRRQGTRADVLHAHNVLAHVANLRGFVKGIRTLLKDDGTAIIEVPYVRDMITRCEFDTIYHEHLCYFSLTSLNHLFRQHGLVIQDVEQIPIHGGSLRLFVVKGGLRRPGPHVHALLDDEARWVGNPAFYTRFAKRVKYLKQSLSRLLIRLRKDGKHVAAYGAAAKGSILLNYLGLGAETLDFVVDRSTYKQRHYMPGSHLPIYSPLRLLEVMPDYVLLLTWNFAEEIMKQQAEYQERGGHFIIPIPEVAVI